MEVLVENPPVAFGFDFHVLLIEVFVHGIVCYSVEVHECWVQSEYFEHDDHR